MSFTSSLLVLAAALPAGDACELPEPQAFLQETKLEWFTGSWDALLERAAAEKRLVFVEFKTSWCAWCRKLEKTTLNDPAVIAELGDVLCYAIDGESERGQPLAKKFHVRNYPTLVFLNPDGETRDILKDYLAPQSFLAELQRIERDEGTLGHLRSRVQEAPEDLEARYELALKLEKLGDTAGYEEQIAAIAKLDPEGRSSVARRVRLTGILAQVKQDLKLAPVYAFLDGQPPKELLYPAWQAVWTFERYHFDRSRTAQEAEQHRLKWLAACRELWTTVPDDLRARVGNNIAWYLYEYRQHVGLEDLRFALDVAKKCAALTPDDPYVVDTLACCLHALGQKTEALATIRRCIELDPKNPQWQSRLEEFLAADRQDG